MDVCCCPHGRMPLRVFQRKLQRKIRTLAHDAIDLDLSIVGFDDIQSASYHVPSLTTIRQPLKLMGSTAAAALLRKLAHETLPLTIEVEPELVVRESSGPPRGRHKGHS